MALTACERQKRYMKRLHERANAAAPSEHGTVPADPEINPETVDPIKILNSIAADPKLPASARVVACRILLTASPRLPQSDAERAAAVAQDYERRLLAKTAEILNRGRTLQ